MNRHPMADVLSPIASIHGKGSSSSRSVRKSLMVVAMLVVEAHVACKDPDDSDAPTMATCIASADSKGTGV